MLAAFLPQFPFIVHFLFAIIIIWAAARLSPSLIIKENKNQILFDPIKSIEDIEKNLQEKQRVYDYFIILSSQGKHRKVE